MGRVLLLRPQIWPKFVSTKGFKANWVWSLAGGWFIAATPFCMVTPVFNIATPFWKEFVFQRYFNSKFVSGCWGGLLRNRYNNAT